MARNVSNGAEVGEELEDRRMNAYMAGMETTNVGAGGEEDEDEVEASHFRRQRRRARRMEY